MKIKRSFICILTCLCCSVSFAQWTQLPGFEGGQAITFTTYKNKVLVGTNGGIYQTLNTGSAWNYLSENYVMANFSSKAYTRKLLGSTNYLYSLGYTFKRSSDDGATWQKMGIIDSVSVSDFTLLNDTMYLMGTVLPGGSLRLYRSSDNGTSFVAGAFIPGQFNFMSQMNVVNDKLYVIIPDFVNGDSIKTSVNGIAFKNVDLAGIPAGSQLSDLAGDGTNLYVNLTNFNAGFINTVYKYDGATWTDIGTGIPAQSQLFNLFYIGNSLFTSLFDGMSFTMELYTLRNGDVTWKKATTDPFGRLVSTMISVGTDSIMCSTFENSGVFFSSDNGATWTTRNTGLKATQNFLVKGAGTNNVIVAGDKNVWISSDNGNTFTASGSGLPAAFTVYRLKKNKDAIFLELSNPSAIYYSTNDGGSWTKLPYPAGQQYHDVFYPTNGGLYMAIRDFNNGFKMYYASSQGAAWTEITANLPSDIDLNQLMTLSGNATDLYLSGRTTIGANKIYRSTDQGSSYTLDMAGLPASFASEKAVANSLACPDSTFYLVISDSDNHMDSVYVRSGAVWKPVFGKYNANNAIFYGGNAISANFTNTVFEGNGTLYTIMFDSIYRSDDQGISWTLHQNGMYPAVRPLSLVPTGAGLLSSTYEHGVWKNAQLPNSADHSYTQGNRLYSFPNPASDHTFISYNVRKGGRVELELFDATGRKIREMMNGIQPEGHYNLRVHTADLEKGIYFYSLKTNGFRQAGKLIVE